MADGQQDAENEAISFELLPNIELVDGDEALQNLTQEQRDALYKWMDAMQVPQGGENEGDTEDFEPNSVTHRHVKWSDADLDDIASAGIKETTKWQTKWVVTVFKGNLSQVSVKYFFLK